MRGGGGGGAGRYMSRSHPPVAAASRDSRERVSCWSQGPSQPPCLSFPLWWMQPQKAFTSVAGACRHLRGCPPGIWGAGSSVLPGPTHSQSPQYSRAEPLPPAPGPHLRALTLVDEEDAGEGVREAAAVGSEEASSLVHVGPELERLLLCGVEQAEAPGAGAGSQGRPRPRGRHSLV